MAACYRHHSGLAVTVRIYIHTKICIVCEFMLCGAEAGNEDGIASNLLRGEPAAYFVYDAKPCPSCSSSVKHLLRKHLVRYILEMFNTL
jgi:hypothetical protein